MPALTREERETVILTNDLGEITIHSTSPTMQRRLHRRLGPPTSKTGECQYWEGLTTDTVSFALPSRKRTRGPATPEQVERGRQLARHAHKPKAGDGV